MPSAGFGGALAGLATCSFAWCQMAAATVWTKVAKTTEERDASRKTRINGFLSISSLSLRVICCGGASQVLDHVKTNHPKQALYCVAYLTFTAVCQLICLITATIPFNFPGTVFMAGLGEWLSAIFVLVVFHLNVMEFWECKKVEYSLIVSSLIMSFYFYQSVCPQGPMTRFVIAKLQAFMVWFSCCFIQAIRILLSYRGYSKSSGRKGPLPRLCMHIRND